MAVSDTENTKDRSALLNLVEFISPQSSGSKKLLGPRHRWRESEQFRHTELQYSGDWLYETPKEPKKPIVFKVNRLQRSISLGNITRLGCHPPLIVVTHTPKYEHFELIYMRQRHRAMRILRNRLKKPAPEFPSVCSIRNLNLWRWEFKFGLSPYPPERDDTTPPVQLYESWDVPGQKGHRENKIPEAVHRRRWSFDNIGEYNGPFPIRMKFGEVDPSLMVSSKYVTIS